MQAAAPPPGAPPQPVGAPSDERALKHHYFFQKLYTPSAIDGDDDICFGTGYRAPKVPIVLQSIPEGKDAYSYFNTHGFKEQGDEDESRRKAMLSIVDAFVTENLEVSKYSKQYSCRIDGVQFPNHAAAVTHMHDVHKNRIEVLLFDLLQDMEQNHMGYFFSKLLYSDFIFPSPIFHSKELSSEFPSVLAPDLERLEPGKAKPAANGKPEKKKQSKPNGASAATPGASFGFTEEELQQMERRLFSGRFLVDASTEAKLSAKSHAPTPVPVPVAAVPSATPPTSASAATAAAVAAATAKGKAEAAAKDSAAAAEKAAAKKKEKEAKEKAEKERAEKEARDQAAREKQAADKAAKEKADKERADKAEKERERQRREAERKQAEKERLEKERAAKAAADAAERERVRLESTAEFKRVKKQMEDELMADIFEEVITDFMSKLAARTLQEQRREDEKTKQEQAERAAAEAEAQHEQDVTAKEKRNIEKKLLRDLKKIEGDRVIDDLIDEVVFEENLLLAPDLLQEMRREVLAAASAAPVAATPAPAVSRRPSAAPAAAVQAPLPPHPVPLASAAAANASWNPPAATAQRGAQPAARGAPVPVAVPAATRPTAPPTMLRSGGKAAAGKAPAMAVPAYQPFGLAAAVTPPSSLSASAESGEGADEFDEYLVQERIKLNLDTDEHDADDDHLPAQPSAAAANAANIFGLFSSKLTEPVTGPPSANAAAAPFVPSPRRVGAGGGKPSAAAEPSVPQAVEPPSRQGGMSPPPPPLRSVPEDFGFDPQLSVTCYNLPSIVPVNRGEMLGFFRDIPIAVAPPDFAPKVQVLRGAESGACYVQFENPAAVQKAMTRDRLMLRDRSIRVVPAQGLRTSNSGQRFALNVQTRNAQLGGAAVEPPVAPFRSAPSPVLKAPEPVHAGTAPTPPLVEPVKSLAAIAAAAAAEQPVKSAAEVEAPAAGSASAFTGFGLPALIPDFRPVAAPTSQHSLSSLLNTEQDTIVTPFDRKAKSGAAIGSAVGAPGKAPGPVSKAPGPGSLGLMAPAPAPAPAASLDDEDANNDETFASSFGGDGTFDPSGQFVTGGPKAPDPRAGGPPPGAMAMMGGGPPMHMGHPQHPGAHSMYAAQLPLPLPAPNAAYMRAASPPAPQQYRGPPGMNARVVTPPPPGFHVPLALPMQAPGGFAPPKGMAYPPPGMVPPQQQQETRQPTVAPASSAEAAFMDRFL